MHWSNRTKNKITVPVLYIKKSHVNAVSHTYDFALCVTYIFKTMALSVADAGSVALDQPAHPGILIIELHCPQII